MITTEHVLGVAVIKIRKVLDEFPDLRERMCEASPDKDDAQDQLIGDVCTFAYYELNEKFPNWLLDIAREHEDWFYKNPDGMDGKLYETSPGDIVLWHLGCYLYEELRVLIEAFV